MSTTPRITTHTRLVPRILYANSSGKPLMLISSLFQVKGLRLCKQTGTDVPLGHRRWIFLRVQSVILQRPVNQAAGDVQIRPRRLLIFDDGGLWANVVANRDKIPLKGFREGHLSTSSLFNRA